MGYEILRTLVNKPGVVFDPLKTHVLFAEDYTQIKNNFIDHETRITNIVPSQWSTIASTINYSGSVGIGTTSPTEKLHVAGTGLFTGTYSNGQIKIGSINQGGKLSFLRGSDGLQGATFGFNSATTIGAFSLVVAGGASSFGITTNAQQRMLISNLGMVTFNETQSASSHFRLSSQPNLNTLYLNATSGFIGLNTNTPTALIDLNSDVLRLRTAKTPASSADTGNVGDHCWDSNYLYVCVSTNSWKRIALTTF